MTNVSGLASSFCNEGKNAGTNDRGDQKQEAQIRFPRRLQSDATPLIADHGYAESVRRDDSDPRQVGRLVAHPPVPTLIIGT
jgi:hypothetical protein